MPWSGWPTTLVSQLTFGEWMFSLRPGRELLAGYTLQSSGAWHVFGDDRWVWFNGVITGNDGAVEIVSQWAEAENLAISHRHWRWVHWRNPSKQTVYVAPRFVLAPPLEERELRAVGQMSRAKRIWTIVDVASNSTSGLGVFEPPPDDDGGGAGGGGDQTSGVRPGMAVRALKGQRVRHIELAGDDRFLPLDELDARVDRLVRKGSRGR